MANDETKAPRPFDVGIIKYLVELMSRRDLSEIDLREGDRRIRLRRGPRRTTITTAAMPAVPPAPTPIPPPAPATAGNSEPARPARNLQEIKSPTPGTFYSKPNPEAEPYVQQGTRVNPTTVVCLIEAMKIFNEITADCSGVVTEVLVENGQAVEYDQVLFRVDPTA